MLIDKAELLEEYYDKGYGIIITDHPYIDNAINDISETNGVLCYSSDVFDERPLSEVPLDSVVIFKKIIDAMDVEKGSVPELGVNESRWEYI